MVRITIGTESNKLSVDVRIAGQGQFAFLQEQYSRTFCHDKAVAVLVIWTRSALRVIITGTHSSQHAEDIHYCIRNGRIDSPGQHTVCSTLLDEPECLSNGVSSGGATCGNDRAWTMKLMMCGYCGGRSVNHAQAGRNHIVYLVVFGLYALTS